MDTNVSIYIYTGIIVGLVFLTIARSIAFFKMTMTASKNLHAQMFGALLRAKMRFFDTNPSGRILNRFSKDMGVVDELLPRAMMEAIQILLVMISILILIVITNYFMVITVVVLGSVFWVLRRWFLTTAKLLKHLEGSSKSPVYSHLNSSLNGITTIRVCRAEEVLTKEFDNHQDVNTSSWYLTLVCTASFGLWLDMITVLFTAIVVFSFIAMHEFGVSGSSVGLAISQSLILTGMLQYGIRQSSEVVNQMISVERILQYTTLDEEDNSLEGNEEDKEWPKEGKITFKHMNLRYAENELPVLSDMNVTINPGEKIGIVGRTGAGKSSLIASVFRLALIDGAIEIDGIDTKTICLSQLRKKISIIPQEPVLFSASMRFNLDPFGEFDDQRLWNVLKEVELKDAISSLDFEVDEGGANFSLGQRQLICLARAILRNNKILVLDEATANVDLKTDELIQATIRRKFTNCTVLTIAHRLNTIMESDKILVMDRGSVAEYEHPHLLLQRENGIFMSMVKQTGPQMTRKLQRIAEDAYNNRINRTRL